MSPRAQEAPFRVVSCPALAAATGCTVSGEGDALVLRGDVLGPDVVYAGGSLRLDANGVIACVGCDCAAADARVVTCPASVIGPGFVNPHDHVAYDAMGPTPLGPERYDHRHDWRLGLRGHTKLEYTGGASTVQRAAQELRMLLGGVTTLAGAAGRRGLVRNADLSDLGEGLPTAPADSETFPLDDVDGRLVTSGCGYGSDHADAGDVARAGEFLGHLGEGVDRAAENELDCALEPAFDLIAPNTGVVHAVAARADEAAALGARGALVVWSPRSNLALYGNTAPVPLLMRSGVEVALGTDWLLTGSMNLLRELDCARAVSSAYFDGALDDHALFAMVTTAGARAVGAGDALGRLAVGFLGDVMVVERHDREPYSAAVAANPADFQLILRGGVPLYGRADLVETLAPGACEPLDVCGTAQRVCTADSGFTLEALSASADATYPLFACGVPPDEPSCVPARPGEYDGLPTPLDRDGDGIPDATDLCPAVFDPIRPLDEGAQADADADGRGDACDPCPLDPDDACVALTGDRDADGIADTVDACPGAFDPIQEDTDADGRGDACDWCTAPNPGASPCVVPIATLRDPGRGERPPLHTLVEVDAALVTALRPNSGSSRGFYIEDAAAPYSGIFVYTGSTSPGVAVGDRVSLRGRYDLYYDLDEIDGATLLAREELGVEPEPVLAEASELGDGGALARGYASMLVRLENARVATTNPDAPSDYDETLLDGSLRLDDLLDPELDNTFDVGTSFSSITGVLAYSFDHQKLLPRGPEDFVP